MGWKLVSTEVGMGVHRYTNPAVVAAIAAVMQGDAPTTTKALLEHMAPGAILVRVLVGAPHPENVDVRTAAEALSFPCSPREVVVERGGLVFSDPTVDGESQVVNVVLEVYLQTAPWPIEKEKPDAHAQSGV